ncbi:MAG: DeoR/GlpR transcriptional regulator [Rhodospirillaceae bacterium]|nr:DeoR/GlpR transcriptional regulator [Rhodospirillaceae bacterium]
MLAVERRDRILEILKDARFVSVNDLHDDLQVSRETIRRDINQLADEKRLIKTHGGAHSISRAEPAFADRMAANLPAKRAIGNRAADLVPDDATVMIDSGTTCIFTAEALMERRGLTVITNDIHVAGKLADRNDNRVLMLGGELVNGESATMGRDATAMLENYFADFSFIGISSLSDEGDLCDYTREAAALRSMMIHQARTPVLVGDHDKFGWSGQVRVDGLERVGYLVTNRALAPSLSAHLKKLGVVAKIAKA